MLPKDARTLLGTKPVPILNMYEVKPGKYYHFGLENGIIRNLPNNVSPTRDQARYWYRWTSYFKDYFYPILAHSIMAYLRPNSNLVFPVGLYCGTDKPSDSNEYLKYFVNEAH